ncbi:MAG TPA: hypothetical protein VHE60_01885 [Pyrinomonadaceae bacterium]|nr:hypothetical protein [Pyrinomonadaceae bacterium]
MTRCKGRLPTHVSIGRPFAAAIFTSFFSGSFALLMRFGAAFFGVRRLVAALDLRFLTGLMIQFAEISESGILKRRQVAALQINTS